MMGLEEEISKVNHGGFTVFLLYFGIVELKPSMPQGTKFLGDETCQKTNMCRVVVIAR